MTVTCCRTLWYSLYMVRTHSSRRKTANWPYENQIVQHPEMYSLRYYFIIMFTIILICSENFHIIIVISIRRSLHAICCRPTVEIQLYSTTHSTW